MDGVGTGGKILWGGKGLGFVCFGKSYHVAAGEGRGQGKFDEPEVN